MYCNNCGFENEEGMQFCANCGAQLFEQVVSTSVPSSNCPNCGAQLEPGMLYCENCGHAVADVAPPEKQKTFDKKIIAAVVAALAVLIVAISVITGLISSANPIKKVEKALANTLKIKNAEIVMTDGDYEESVEIEFNKKKKSFYVHTKNDYGEQWVEYADGEGTSWSEYESYYDGSTQESENEFSKNEEEMIDLIFDVLNKKKGAFEELIEETGMDEFVEADKAEKELGKLIKKLSSKKNREDILGLEVKKKNGETIYSFTPDAYKLMEFIVENGEKLLTEDAYEELEDAFDDIDKDEFEDEEITVEVIVKGKYIVGINVDDGYSENEIRLENINKTDVEHYDD